MTTIFTIGAQEFNVVKQGYAQAQQVAAVGNWLSIYGSTAARRLFVDGTDLANKDGFDIAAGVLSAIDADALVELFSLVFGCPLEAAKESFEIELLLDGVTAVYENQPAVKRLLNRFFLPKGSSASMGESSTK